MFRPENPTISWTEIYCEHCECDDYTEEDIEQLPHGKFKCKLCGYVGIADEFYHIETDSAY